MMKALMIVLLGLAACGQVQPPEQVTDDQTADLTTTSVSSELRFSAPTPEMLAAALTGDPDRMAAAIPLAAACHAPSTCPAQFGSCGTWSSFSSCGSSFCTGGCVRPPKCSPSNLNCEFSQQFGRTSESFQVCFDAARNGCTQWRNQTAVTGCGCGGFE